MSEDAGVRGSFAFARRQVTRPGAAMSADDEGLSMRRLDTAAPQPEHSDTSAGSPSMPDLSRPAKEQALLRYDALARVSTVIASQHSVADLLEVLCDQLHAVVPF